MKTNILLPLNILFLLNLLTATPMSEAQCWPLCNPVSTPLSNPYVLVESRNCLSMCEKLISALTGA